MSNYSNFKKVSKKAAGKCCLKNHYRRGHAEVIGILDLWASNDPERFVFPRVDAIVARCKKFQTKTLHGKGWVEKILRDLRVHHVISKPLTRVRDYQEMRGFIVAPHDSLTVRKPGRKGSLCLWVGQLQAPGCWKREILLKDSEGKPLPEPKLGPVYWAGWPEGWQGNCTDNTAANSTDKSTDNTAEKSTGKSTAKSTVTTLQHASDDKTLKPENRPLTFRTLGTEGTERTNPTLPAKVTTETAPETTGAEKQQAGGQAGCVSSSSSSSPTKSKTKPDATSQAEIQWQKFFAEAGDDLPEEMRYALPTAEERDAVLQQLHEMDGNVENLTMAIGEWAEMRCPPLAGRTFGRWACWLKEGQAKFEEWKPTKKQAVIDAREEAAKKANADIEAQILEQIKAEIAERAARVQKFAQIEPEEEEAAAPGSALDYL